MNLHIWDFQNAHNYYKSFIEDTILATTSEGARLWEVVPDLSPLNVGSIFDSKYSMDSITVQPDLPARTPADPRAFTTLSRRKC